MSFRGVQIFNWDSIRERGRESMARRRRRLKGEHVPFISSGKPGVRKKPPEHGTLNEYNRHGCRCDACRDGNRLHGAKYRKRDPKKHVQSVKRSIQKRTKIIQALKNVPCTDCGIKYPYYVMQFDHLRDKKVNMSSDVTRFGLKTLLEEAKKCEVVCANCHMERTNKRRVEKRLQSSASFTHIPI